MDCIIAFSSSGMLRVMCASMCRTPHVLMTHYMIQLSTLICCVILLLILLRFIVLRASHVLSLIHLSLGVMLEHLPDALLLRIVLCLFEGEDLVKLLLDELEDFLSLRLRGGVHLHEEAD